MPCVARRRPQSTLDAPLSSSLLPLRSCAPPPQGERLLRDVTLERRRTRPDAGASGRVGEGGAPCSSPCSPCLRGCAPLPPLLPLLPLREILLNLCSSVFIGVHLWFQPASREGQGSSVKGQVEAAAFPLAFPSCRARARARARARSSPNPKSQIEHEHEHEQEHDAEEEGRLHDAGSWSAGEDDWTERGLAGIIGLRRMQEQR